jgi:asparagine synthase (glutamine-hydrolysing)
MPAVYDEPFADPSQLPTLLVAEMTRQHVTVALSGDGGDELFGGYSRYQQTQRVWHYLSLLPAICRPLLKTFLQSIPVYLWDIGFKFFAAQGKALQAGRGGDRLHKLAEIINADSRHALYRNMMSYWQQPEQLVLGATEPLTALNTPGLGQDFMQQMMYTDAISYLPDDILTKVDRAAMSVSLETRIPLLDHRVVEFAFSLPQTLRFQHGQGKWILRQLLYQYVPKHLLDRPKAGFAVPLESWLRGELREWAENLLDASRLQQQGIFDVVLVRQKWTEHINGQRNWHFYLWSILMFQMWLNGQ